MDKLEKHIKEKLEQRTIVPSEGAWDKIASQVRKQSPQKRNTWFPYAMAASIVGILLVSVFFFTEDNSEVKQTQVVDTETKIETKVLEEETVVEEILQKENSVVSEIKIESKVPERKEELNSKQSIYNSALAKQETKRHLQDEIEINSDKLIAQKVEEVVAQVELMESARKDVSDAEVDSLLRAAQRQILTERLFSNGKSVNAQVLLAEVEDELDESFRDQIFDALKSGYFKLRTAVADRNK